MITNGNPCELCSEQPATCETGSGRFVCAECATEVQR